MARCFPFRFPRIHVSAPLMVRVTAATRRADGAEGETRLLLFVSFDGSSMAGRQVGDW